MKKPNIFSKRLSTAIICIALSIAHAHAQNVGIGTDVPDPSARLDIASTSSGMLVPRMTTAQRTAITSPANGLLVYDITTNSFWFRKGNTWTEIGNANEGWKLSGNTGNNASYFLGTVDEQPLQFRVNNVLSGYVSPQISSSTSFGYEALASNTGVGNVGVGYWALRSNTVANSNIAIGPSALFSNTDRSNLVAIGDSALYNNGVGATSSLHANKNTAVGSKALFANTTGFSNTATGADALRSNTTGTFNTANGTGALLDNTTGLSNTAIGGNALQFNTAGIANTAIGVNALIFNTTGSLNTANGVNALLGNTTGNKNTANGHRALEKNTTGSNNTANGEDALYSNTTGFSNVAVGSNALYGNTDRSNLVAIGDSALYNNGVGAAFALAATKNTAVGSKALFANTTGRSNTATGANALFSNTTSDGNTANGSDALFNNTTGDLNTANGANALFSNTTGRLNTANGLQALYSNTTGFSNTAIGLNALFSNTTGFSNTAIGSAADVTTGNLSNATAIGSDAKVGCSNCLVLGNNNVNVGIGISNPTNKLHVIGKTATSNFQMTSGAVAGHVMESDAAGNASWVSLFSIEQDPQVGSNVTNYVSKWNGNALVASTIFDNGNVGIGTVGSGVAKLTVTGNALLNGQVGVNSIATNTALLVKSLPGNTWLNVQEDNNNTLRFAVSNIGTVGINAHSATTALNVRMSGPSITRILDLQTTNGPSMFSVSSNGTVQSNAGINAGTTMSAPAGAVFGTGPLDATLNVYGTRGIALGGATNDFITPTGEAFSFGNYFRNLNGQVFVTETFRITSNGNVSIPTGNLSVSGSLSKGSGSFKIDHPLDPYNKYLYHSFVESPDMMNVYNGNITTNAEGEAVVEMPDWFEALNKDFRYQLTVIGEFAQAIVDKKLANNRFSIKTDKPGIEVSWQITGIRKDRFAEENRIPIEENKKGEEIGTLLHPSNAGNTYSKNEKL